MTDTSNPIVLTETQLINDFNVLNHISSTVALTVTDVKAADVTTVLARVFGNNSLQDNVRVASISISDTADHIFAVQATLLSDIRFINEITLNDEVDTVLNLDVTPSNFIVIEALLRKLTVGVHDSVTLTGTASDLITIGHTNNAMISAITVTGTALATEVQTLVDDFGSHLNPVAVSDSAVAVKDNLADLLTNVAHIRTVSLNNTSPATLSYTVTGTDGAALHTLIGHIVPNSHVTLALSGSVAHLIADYSDGLTGFADLSGFAGLTVTASGSMNAQDAAILFSDFGAALQMLQVSDTAAAIASAYTSTSLPENLVATITANLDNDNNEIATTAADIQTILQSATGAVNATAVNHLTGTATELADEASHTHNVGVSAEPGFIPLRLTLAPDVTISVTEVREGKPGVDDLNAISAMTSTPVTANISGTAHELAQLQETNNAYTVTVTAGSVLATDLTTIDAATTIRVNADAVTEISGDLSQDTAAIDASGINLTGTENIIVTDTGTVDVSDLSHLDNNTSGKVDVRAAATIRGSALDLAAELGSSELITSGLETILVTGDTVSATNLLSIITATHDLTLNSGAQSAIDLSAMTTLTGSIDEINAVANELSLISDKDITVSTNATITLSADESSVDAGILATIVSDFYGLGAKVNASGITAVSGLYSDVSRLLSEYNASPTSQVSLNNGLVITVLGDTTNHYVHASELSLLSATPHDGISFDMGAGVILDGTASEIHTLLGDHLDMTLPTNWAIQVENDGAPTSATVLQTILTNTTGHVDASAVRVLSGDTSHLTSDIEKIGSGAGQLSLASDVAINVENSQTGSTGVDTLNIIDAATTGIVTATITGAASVLAGLAAAAPAPAVANAYTVTVIAGINDIVTASDLNAIDAATSVAVIASSVHAISGTLSADKAAVTGSITLRDDVAVTVEDALTAGTDVVSALNTIAAHTTNTVTASISGSALDLANLTGTNEAYTVTVTGTEISVSDLATIDGVTSVRVDARAANTISGSASALATELGSNGLLTSGSETILVTGTTVAAKDLISIITASKDLTTGHSPINLSAMTTLTGSMADIKIVTDDLNSYVDLPTSLVLTVSDHPVDASSLYNIVVAFHAHSNDLTIDASSITAISGQGNYLTNVINRGDLTLSSTLDIQVASYNDINTSANSFVNAGELNFLGQHTSAPGLITWDAGVDLYGAGPDVATLLSTSHNNLSLPTNWNVIVGNDYVRPGTILASNISTILANTTGFVNVSSSQHIIIGNATDLVSDISNSRLTGRGNIAITVSNGNQSGEAGVIALNTLDLATTGLVTANINGAASELGLLTAGANAYTVTVNDTGTVNASDLNKINAATTITVDAHLVTAISGTIEQDTAAIDASGVALGINLSGTENIIVTDTGTVDVSALSHLDSKTSGTVNAILATTISGSASDLAIELASGGLTTSDSVIIKVTDTSVYASTLHYMINSTKDLDGTKHSTIDLSMMTELSGWSSEIKTVANELSLLKSEENNATVILNTTSPLVLSIVDNINQQTLDAASLAAIVTTFNSYNVNIDASSSTAISGLSSHVTALLNEYKLNEVSLNADLAITVHADGINNNNVSAADLNLAQADLTFKNSAIGLTVAEGVNVIGTASEITSLVAAHANITLTNGTAPVFKVTDTGSAISTALDNLHTLLATYSNLAITVTDTSNPIVLTETQLINDFNVLNHISSTVALTVTDVAAADVATVLDGVVGLITLNSNVTVASISVSDGAAAISSAETTLLAHIGSISNITLNDLSATVLSLTVTQANITGIETLLTKLTIGAHDSVTLTGTATDLEAISVTLNGDNYAKVTAIAVTGTVSATDVSTLVSDFGSKLQNVAVSDSVANIESNIADLLTNVDHLSSVTSNGSLAYTVTGAEGAALNKLLGVLQTSVMTQATELALTGTAAHLKADFAAGLHNLASYSGSTVTVSDASVSLADAKLLFSDFGSALQAVHVSDTAAAIASAYGLGSLPANLIATITANLNGSNVEIATLAADIHTILTNTSGHIDASAVMLLTGNATDLTYDIAAKTGDRLSLNAAVAITATGTQSGSTGVTALNTIDAVTTGIVTASITGAASTLAGLTAGVNAYTVTVDAGIVNASDLKAIDAATTVQVVATSVTGISGTVLDDMAAISASGIQLSGTESINVTNNASISQLTTLSHAGTLTYTTVEDTVNNLYSNNSNWIKNYVNIVVDGSATLADLQMISSYSKGSLTVSHITDIAANLTTNAGHYIQTLASGGTILVSDAASIAQLTTITASNTNNGAITYSSLQDTAANLVSSSHVVSGYVGSNQAITITGNTTVQQLQDIKATDVSGVISYALADTASHLLTLTTGLLIAASVVKVTGTDSLSISDYITLTTAGVSFAIPPVIYDTEANYIVASTSDAGLPIAQLRLSENATDDATNIAKLTNLANFSAVGHTLNIVDTAQNILNHSLKTGFSAASLVLNGTEGSVDDTVTVAQLKSLEALAGYGVNTVTSTEKITVSDTAANLIAGTTTLAAIDPTGAILSANERIITLSEDAINISVVQEKSLMALGVAHDTNGHTTNGHTVNISDTVSNVMGALSALTTATSQTTLNSAWVTQLAATSLADTVAITGTMTQNQFKVLAGATLTGHSTDAYTMDYNALDAKLDLSAASITSGVVFTAGQAAWLEDHKFSGYISIVDSVTNLNTLANGTTPSTAGLQLGGADVLANANDINFGAVGTVGSLISLALAGQSTFDTFNNKYSITDTALTSDITIGSGSSVTSLTLTLTSSNDLAFDYDNSGVDEVVTVTDTVTTIAHTITLVGTTDSSILHISQAV